MFVSPSFAVVPAPHKSFEPSLALLKAAVAGALLAGLAIGATIPTFTQAQVDSGEAIRQLSKIAYDTAMERAAKATSGCTKDKVKIRKEW